MKPYFKTDRGQLFHGDALEMLSDMDSESVQCCITSPPYWGLRDYGVSGQLGLEKTPEEYVSKMVEIFREVRRVLRKDGTLWLNLGSSYAGAGGMGSDVDSKAKKGMIKIDNYYRQTVKGFKPKDMVPIPWMVAMALQSDGWWLRQDIIWQKPNPMPESVTDRCTKSHEYIFLMSKSAKYYYDNEAIREPASYNTHERVARAKIGHKSIPNERYNGIRPRKLAAPGSGIKNNISFDAAMNKMPDTRNKRSVWGIPARHSKMRNDLSIEQKKILVAELIKRGII